MHIGNTYNLDQAADRLGLERGTPEFHQAVRKNYDLTNCLDENGDPLLTERVDPPDDST